MLATLRQRRYVGLLLLSAVVALVCVAAGSWQIARFHQKYDANHRLRANNSDTVVDVARALGPASHPTANGATVEFRQVTATGSYLPSGEALVRGQSVNGNVGYLVVTPLRTDTGILLVARGFVAQTGQAKDTPTVAPAPAGPVTVRARLQPADTKSDRYGALPADQVESINPTEQSARLGQPVWDAYAELLPDQPGGAGLTAIPGPDLSNPAGGADEPQHAAYVVQWYIFAGLALALPFVMAGAESRRDGPPRASNPWPKPETTPTSSTPSTPPAAPRLSRRERRAALDDRLAGRR